MAPKNEVHPADVKRLRQLESEIASGTEHSRIMCAVEESLAPLQFERALDELQFAMASGSERTLSRAFVKWVTGYAPESEQAALPAPTVLNDNVVPLPAKDEARAA